MLYVKLNIQRFAASLSLSITESEPNIAENTSQVTLTITATRTSGTTYWDDPHSGTAYIDGQSIGFSLALKKNQKTGSTSVTATVKHNNDGKKTITCSASIATGTSSGTISAQETFTLMTIPRTSSFSASDTQIEGTCIIRINRASTTFTHNLTYSFAGLTGTIATGVAEYQEWIIPTSFYAKIPNAKSGSCTITCTTISDGNTIGSTSITINVSCNEEKCKPTLSATIIDTNTATKNLTGSSSKLVKGYSTARITPTATAKNGATISSKIVEGQVVSSYLDISKVGKNTFSITAIDSRGFQTNIVSTATMVDYVPLTCSAKVYRPVQTESTAMLDISGNYFNGSFGSTSNALTLKWEYRKKGASSWNTAKTITPTITGNTYKASVNCGTSFPYQDEFEFRVSYSDKLISTTQLLLKLSKGLANLAIFEHAILMNGTVLFYDDDFFVRNEDGTFSKK